VLRQYVIGATHGFGSEALLFDETTHATIHWGYTSTDVLFKDNVTLMAVTPERAIFAKTPERIDVYESKSTGPFIYV